MPRVRQINNWKPTFIENFRLLLRHVRPSQQLLSSCFACARIRCCTFFSVFWNENCICVVVRCHTLQKIAAVIVRWIEKQLCCVFCSMEISVDRRYCKSYRHGNMQCHLNVLFRCVSCQTVRGITFTLKNVRPMRCRRCRSHRRTAKRVPKIMNLATFI